MSENMLRSFLKGIWGGELEVDWWKINRFYVSMAMLCVALKMLGDDYPIFQGWWVVLSPFVMCAIFTLSMLFVKLVTTDDDVDTVDDSMLMPDAQSEKMVKIVERGKTKKE